MIEADLREIVPEPAPELLGWVPIKRGIARQRRRRAAAAVVVTGVAVAGVVIAVTSLQPTHHTQPSPITPTVRDNGPVVFARSAPGVSTELKNSSLFIINPDGSGLRRLTHNAGDVAEATATPNGGRVAYVQEVYVHEHSGYVAHDTLRIVNVNNRSDRVVYRCQETCSYLSWSPDGSMLTFDDLGLRLLTAAGRVRSICVGHCTGSDLEEPSWSPDGQRLAFVRAVEIPVPHGTSSVSAIWVANRDGTDVHQLTDTHCTAPHEGCTQDSTPAWSPDGQRIAFVRMVPDFLQVDQSLGLNPTGPISVVTMNPDGGGLKTMWRCPHHHCSLGPPSWSPSGQSLAFVQGQTQFLGSHYGGTATRSFVVVDAETAQAATVASTRPPVGGNTTISWAPNGKYLAVVEHYIHRPNTVNTLALSRPTLKVLPATHVAPRGPLLWLARSPSFGRSRR